MLRPKDDKKQDVNIISFEPYIPVEKSLPVNNKGLSDAVVSDDIDTINKHLKDGADPNHVFEVGSYTGWSMLAYAVYNNKINAVNALLSDPKTSLNQVFPGTRREWPLLSYAIYNNYITIAESLIKKGAQTKGEVIPNCGWKLLTYSVFYNMPSIVEALLEKGETPNESDPFYKSTFWSGWSLLEYALYNKYRITTLHLLKYNAAIKDDNQKDKIFPGKFRSNLGLGYPGWTYLAYACYHLMSEIIDELLNKGASTTEGKILYYTETLTYLEYLQKLDCLTLANKLKAANTHSQEEKNIPQETVQQLPSLEQNDFADLVYQRRRYVDKSMFIDAVIKDKSSIKIFSFPPGFGKSLNLSLLNYFFNRKNEDQDLQKYIKLLKVAQTAPPLDSHFGQYTVINLNFKNLFVNNYQDALERFCRMLGELYNKHKYLLSKLDKLEKEYFETILRGYIGKKVKESEIKISLMSLIDYINKDQGNNKIIILIDEYDASFRYFIADDNKNDSGKITNLILSFVDQGLSKSNFYQAIFMGRFPFLTHFPTLEQAKQYTLFDSEYHGYFGYTDNDLQKIQGNSGLETLKLETVKESCMYYAADKTLYSPYLVNALVNKTFAKSNIEIALQISDIYEGVLKDSIKKNGRFREELRKLMLDGRIDIPVRTAFDFSPSLKNQSTFNEKENSTKMWSILLACGFLNKRLRDEINSIYELIIPNKSVRGFFTNLQKIAEETPLEIKSPQPTSQQHDVTPPDPTPNTSTLEEKKVIKTSHSSREISKLLVNAANINASSTQTPVKNFIPTQDSSGDEKLNVANSPNGLMNQNINFSTAGLINNNIISEAKRSRKNSKEIDERSPTTTTNSKEPSVQATVVNSKQTRSSSTDEKPTAIGSKNMLYTPPLTKINNSSKPKNSNSNHRSRGSRS